MTHSEPTTLGWTVDKVLDDPPRGLIDLPALQPSKRPPDGAGILVWGPLFGGALIAVGVLAVRFLMRVAA